MTNDEEAGFALPQEFVIRALALVRHSSFVIRHWLFPLP